MYLLQFKLIQTAQEAADALSAGMAPNYHLLPARYLLLPVFTHSSQKRAQDQVDVVDQSSIWVLYLTQTLHLGNTQQM